MLRRVVAGLGVGLGVGLGQARPARPESDGSISSVLLDTSVRPVYPERVLAVADGTVTLAASRLTAAQPGTWGLRWATDSAGGLAVDLGPVTAENRAEVVRPLLGGQPPEPGCVAVLDAGPFDPDPAARGLSFEDVHVPGPLGRYPAWEIPADGDTWVVMVHGRGADPGARRCEYCRRAARARAPAGGDQLPQRRGRPAQPGRPLPPRRHGVGGRRGRRPIRRGPGARRIVLFGWSMGGAITGAFLDRSSDASRVAAVVWDAPLVDWRATLRQQARNRRLPPGLARRWRAR